MKQVFDDYMMLREQPYYFFNKKYFDFISADTYFFGPYVYCIEHALIYEKEWTQQVLLKLAMQRVRRIVTQPSRIIRDDRGDDFACIQKKDIVRICHLVIANSNNFRDRCIARFIKYYTVMRWGSAVKTPYGKSHKNDARNLIYIDLVSTGDVQIIQKEIKSQLHRIYRRNTAPDLTKNVMSSSVYLKDRWKKNNGEPGLFSINGEYGQWSNESLWFPKTKQLIESIVASKFEDSKIVACQVSYLPPHSLIGQHYDGDDKAKGVERYHLVVNSPQGSRMNSGSEDFIFKEGEIFFLEEKKLHGAYNDHSQDRIHVIFDIVPQRDRYLGIQFQSYADWNKWQVRRESI